MRQFPGKIIIRSLQARMDGIWVNSYGYSAGGEPLTFVSGAEQVSVSPCFSLLPLIQSRVILLKWFSTLIQGHKVLFHMSLIFTRLYIRLFWSQSAPFCLVLTHAHTYIHRMTVRHKSGLSMAQLWRPLSLYVEKIWNIIRWIMLWYQLLLTAVWWGKTPALYPNRISGLILVRRNTHRWSDRKN